jgi:hypothetical protein
MVMHGSIFQPGRREAARPPWQVWPVGAGSRQMRMSSKAADIYHRHDITMGGSSDLPGRCGEKAVSG